MFNVGGSPIYIMYVETNKRVELCVVNIFKQSNNIIIEVYICSKLVCVNACLQDTQSYLVLSDLVLCDRENLQTSHSKRDTSTLVRLRFLYIQCTRSWSVCINWKSGWAYNYWLKFGGMQRTFVFLFLKGITPHSKASQISGTTQKYNWFLTRLFDTPNPMIRLTLITFWNKCKTHTKIIKLETHIVFDNAWDENYQTLPAFHWRNHYRICNHRCILAQYASFHRSERRAQLGSLQEELSHL